MSKKDDDQEREQVCIDYFLRVEKNLSGAVDGFDKQFFAVNLREIWSSFEAFLGWKFSAQSPNQMRSLYCKKYQAEFEKWKMSDEFKSSLQTLTYMCPVKDMRPENPEDDVSIDDQKKLEQILKVCWRVRCNLDHGSKDLVSEDDRGRRNRELVKHSTKVVYAILEKTLLEEKII